MKMQSTARFFGFVLVFIVFVSMFSFSAGAETCKVTQNGISMADFDCDGITDVLDNCPNTYNPKQEDANLNRVGDVCDVSLEFRKVEDFVPKEHSKVSFLIKNNGKFLVKDVVANLVVGNIYSGEEDVGMIVGGGEKLVEKDILIPERLEREYRVEAVVGYSTKGIPSEARKEVTKKVSAEFAVNGSADNINNDVAGLTEILVQNFQDVDQGKHSAIYPIKIINHDSVEHSYSLGVSNIKEWGNYEFSPGSSLTVGPGKSQTVFLIVNADNLKILGVQDFDLILRVMTEPVQVKKIGLKANIVKTLGDDKSDLIKGMELLMIVLILGVVAVVLIVSMKKLNEDVDDEEIKPKPRKKKKQAIYPEIGTEMKKEEEIIFPEEPEDEDYFEEYVEKGKKLK